MNLRWILPYYLLSFFLISVVFSCTEKAQSIRNHEGPITSQKNEEDTRFYSKQQNHWKDSHRWEVSYKGAKDKVREVLNPLFQQVFHDQNLTDPRVWTSQTAFEKLELFNRLCINEIDKEKKANHSLSVELKSVLVNYASWAQSQCTSSMYYNCLAVNYLKRSHLSKVILKLSAPYVQPVKDYYQILGMALQISNSSEDNDISDLFLLRFEELLSLKLDDKEREFYRSFVEFSLNKFNEINRSLEKDSKIIKKLPVWKLIFDNQLKFPEPSLLVLLKVASENHFLYDEKGNLTPQFINQLNESQHSKNSFSQRQNFFIKQKIMEPEAVGLKEIKSFDEYFFLIDSLYRKNISVAMGVEFFKGTHQDKKKLIEVTKNYLKFQFIYTLYVCTQLAKNKMFFGDWVQEERVKRAMDGSKEIAPLWVDLKSRFDSIRQILNIILKNENLYQTDFSNFNSLFDHLDTSIKLMAEYAQSMILFYILSKQNFTSRTLLYNQEINTSQIFSWLYEEKLPPLFNYSSGRNVLNSLEIGYVFDFSVRTNVFVLLNIDPDDFMADFLNRLSERDYQLVRNTLDVINSKSQRGSHYEILKNICNGLRSGELPFFKANIKEITSSPFYGNLLTEIITMTTGKSYSGKRDRGEVEKINSGLNILDSNNTEVAEIVRVDLRYFLLMSESMKNSYTRYLRDIKKFNPQLIESKTKKVSEAIDRIKYLRKEYIEKMSKWNDEVGWCTPQILLKEKALREQLVETEKVYLRQVHKEIKRLREPEASSMRKEADASGAHQNSLLESMRMKYSQMGMPESFIRLEKINQQGYLMNNYYLYLRWGSFLKDGFHSDNISIPPIERKVIFEVGSEIDADSDDVSNSTSYFLAYTDSEDEFVRNGLRAIFNVNIASENKRNQFMPMIENQMTRTQIWKTRMLYYASMYRMDREMGKSEVIDRAGKLIEEQSAFLDLVKFSQNERNLYETLSRTEKGYVPLLNSILYNKNPDNSFDIKIWGLFDFPTYLISAELLGNSYEYKQFMANNNNEENHTENLKLKKYMKFRLGAWSLAERFFKIRSNSNRGILIFNYNSDMDQELQKGILQWLQEESQHMMVYRDVLDSKIKTFWERPLDTQPQFDLNINQTYREPMLNEQILMDYDSQLRRFHQKTNHCFDWSSPAPCIDFNN